MKSKIKYTDEPVGTLRVIKDFLPAPDQLILKEEKVNEFHKEMGTYLKYYWIERHLFEDVHGNFQKRGFLTPEEFFAIVVWKSNRSKKGVLDGIRKSKKTVKEITSEIFKAKTLEVKLNVFLSPKIEGIGIPIASAILTVCYPDDFTVVDYRSRASLEKIGVKIKGDPSANPQAYFKYLEMCRETAESLKVSLRNFDRALWGKDFYDGESGLKALCKKIS